MTGPCVVLVVDDNKTDSHLVENALEFVGFDGVVVSVENAPQAFSYLSGRPPYANVPKPHIIMLDLSMPILNGFDVLRELKSHPAWAAIPVIIFTSSRRESDQAEAAALGAKRFVTKPVDWNGFLEVARDVQQACCSAA